MKGPRVKVIGEARLRREIDGLRRKLRLAGGEFADLAARTVRDTVVRNAQPFGGGGKAMKAGAGAVRGDILKCLRPVAEGQRGRRGVIDSIGEARRWHQGRRGKTGRVSSGKRRPVVESIFREYLNEVLKKVGQAKGSLLGGSAPRLRGRFAAWMTRWKSEGKSKRRPGIGGAVWKFSAAPPHVASGYVMGERGVRRVMLHKDKNLKRVLERDLRRKLKKGGRRINR